jgi:hypothetical protein
VILLFFFKDNSLHNNLDLPNYDFNRTLIKKLPMNTTKITIKIHEPLLKAFDKQLESVFLKRDAFLNHIIKREITNLAEQLEGKRLSPKAKRYISQELKRLGTKNINVVVEKEVAKVLNEIVERHNIVRDAFMNRLILFLHSSDELLTYLNLPLNITDMPKRSGYEGMPTSPFFAIESVIFEPFYYLEIAAKQKHNSGVYLLDLPPKNVGFSCFIDDYLIPNTVEFCNFS